MIKKNTTFSYKNDDEKNPLNLSFTLDSEDKVRLIEFHGMLEKALKDVQKEIDKIQ